jgi:diguanylate cyclase (GGDEF)-like protein
VLAFLMVSLAKERVEMGLRLAAFTDPLTGLGNRRAFFEKCQPIVDNGARLGRPAATIVFDLDRFKEVNDRHGHPVGDAVLQTFAATARRFLRPGDFAGRLGGEEFAITLPDTSSENACRVAERITRAFAQAVAEMSGQAFHCTASAGVAVSSSAGQSLDELLSVADRALYEAKELGGGQVRQSGIPAGQTADRAA